MQRYLAVQIHHPRLSHAGIFRLNKPQRRTRRLVTISPGQTEANVEIRLLEGRKKSTLEVTRSLHTFFLKDLPAEADRRTEILLEAEYDGRATATLSVLVAGVPRESVRLTLGRERRGWLLVAAAAVLMLAAGGLGLLLFSPDREETALSVGEADRSGAEDESAGDPGGAAVEAAEESAAADEREAADERTAAEGDNGEAGEGEEREPGPPPRQEFVVYFTPDDTVLTREAEARLEGVAAALAESGADTPVRIVGHTALFGTEEGRASISRGRAEAVYEYLTALGWRPEVAPTVAWEASREPVTREREEQELNRRVEIEIGGQ